MFQVHQPWDPLKVCVVGRSYPPEFYKFIENIRLRELFQRIAKETEEDFQFLSQTLESLGVKTIRPYVPNIHVNDYLTSSQRIPGPVSMIPRDQMIMIGNNFFVFPYNEIAVKASGKLTPTETNWNIEVYNQLRGADWPKEFAPFDKMPEWVQQECATLLNFKLVPGVEYSELIKNASKIPWWKPVLDIVEQQGNTIIKDQYQDLLNCIPANGITRIGYDLYFGNSSLNEFDPGIKELQKEFFSEYRCHWVKTDGHIDGCFTPVKPGLIVSIREIDNYAETFPGWEVVYLEGESWDKVKPFLDLKKKNQGKWWIQGHEYDDELIEYVNTWLNDWVGYAEESVFDVNLLVVDQQNIIVNGYNEKAFEAFSRHGITAHICPIRHRYFWDGGIHCVTLDLHREGSKQDFFPNRAI